jgi:hypothetical protein
MKLETMMQELNERPSDRHPPDYVLWMPPAGAAIECPPGMDLLQASKAADRIAQRHPGRVVAVYQLSGYSVAPIPEASFTPSAPDDPMFAEIDDNDKTRLPSSILASSSAVIGKSAKTG